MVLWIESQPTPFIALLVFAISYALATIIFLVAVTISRSRIAEELKGMTPAILTPLAVIAGLLIAFLASRVWSNLDLANGYIAHEATQIREAVLLADTLPETTRIEVRAAVRQYWPEMAAGRATLRRIPHGVTDMMRALLSFVPATIGQQVAQERAIVAIEQALEARKHRIVLSQATISPVQWLVIALLGALILVAIAIVHIDRPITAAVGLVIVSTAVASCLVVLMVHDRPFATGGITLQPNALRDIGVSIQPAPQ